MASPTDTICALATPSGTGALGIVRLSGVDARARLLELCARKRLRPRHMYHLRLRAAGEVLDDVMACYLPGPRSYTGEDMAEVYGHGGELNMQRLLEAFVRRGARVADPGEFTRRAFLNGRLDLTQAEAIAELIAARSERALRNAQACLAGALGERVRGLRQRVVQLAAQLEAQIDFVEEVELTEPPTAALQQLRHELEALAATYQRQRRLENLRVGIVGAANVGKSSLFNALLGTRRALVDDAPGTTRDYLEAEVAWDGRRVTLIDTAGDRGRMSTTLEEAGRALAAPVLEACDLLLCVVDLTTEETGEARPARAHLVVGSKLDRARPGALEALRQRSGDVIATSATCGTGLDELRRVILAEVSQDEVETVQVSRARQWQALDRAQRAVHEAARRSGMVGPELLAEHLREALQRLDEITGDGATDEVLDQVFSTFCIGK
jgi:tRNA modification GTPase